MTEIPEEAVAAAAREFYGAAYGSVGEAGNAALHEGAREALAAALPHLRVQETRPRPVTDEAVELALKGQQGFIDSYGTGYPKSAMKTALVAALPLLRGAPAPRPVVDREALARLIRSGYNAMLCNGDIPGWTIQEEVSKVADAILALLPTEEDTRLERAVDFDGYMIQATVNGDVEVSCVHCPTVHRFEPSKDGLLEIFQTARNHMANCPERVLSAAVEDGKRLVRVAMGPGHTPTTGEVEKHIPEALRETYWRRYVDKYFAEEDTKGEGS